MKKRLIMIATFVLIFMVSAVVHAPASILYYVQDRLPRALNIMEVSGSLWHGKAMNVQWQNRSQRIDLGAVAWEVNWSWLLTGKLSLDIRFGQNSPMRLAGKGTLELTPADMTIASMTVRFPVESLTPFIPSPVPFSALGQASLTVSGLTFIGERCADGRGVVQWNQGEVAALSQQFELGLTNGSFACQNGTVSFNINQYSPMFQSQLKGSLLGNRSIKVSGQVQPKQGVPSMLLQQLKTLPEAENGQGYSVNYQGRW